MVRRTYRPAGSPVWPGHYTPAFHGWGETNAPGFSWLPPALPHGGDDASSFVKPLVLRCAYRLHPARSRPQPPLTLHQAPVTDYPPPMRNPFVSVVLAVRNEAAAIERCLDALMTQSYPHDRMEVIVADGCSQDGTPEIVEGYAARAGVAVRLVDNPQRLTPAGFNAAIRAARGDVIIILGARTEPAADFVAESVAALERTGADVVGGVVESVPLAGHDGAAARAIAAALRSPFGVGDARYRYANAEQQVDTVNYGAYRRQVFERIGLFDEGLQWVEDDEFNYRLRAAGGRIVLSPRIRIRYYARATLPALWRQQWRWGFNKPLVARRHPAQMRPRHAVPALFVLALGSGALLAPWWRPARWLLGLIVGSYTVANVLAVALIRHQVRRGGSTPRTAPLTDGADRTISVRAAADVTVLSCLPLAFAAMHLAYGSGILAGLARLAWRSGEPPAPAGGTLSTE